MEARIRDVGLDGNGYGLTITAGSGGGGNSGGNNAGGGGGGDATGAPDLEAAAAEAAGANGIAASRLNSRQEVALYLPEAMEEMAEEAAVAESSQQVLQMELTDKLVVVAMAVEAAVALAPALMI